MEEELRRARGARERAVGRDTQPEESCCMGDAAMGFSSDAAIGFTGERHGSQRWWCAQVGERERRGRNAQREAICRERTFSEYKFSR
jgi:hypothetical protein